MHSVSVAGPASKDSVSRRVKTRQACALRNKSFSSATLTQSKNMVVNACMRRKIYLSLEKKSQDKDGMKYNVI